MFIRQGKDQWKLECEPLTAEEILVLYLALDDFLRKTENADQRQTIVYLTEKLYELSKQINIKTITDE